jgi:hypothetical protein
VLEPNAAGVDVGAREMFVAVPRCATRIRCVCLRPSLRISSNWLIGSRPVRCDHGAMESTGRVAAALQLASGFAELACANILLEVGNPVRPHTRAVRSLDLRLHAAYCDCAMSRIIPACWNGVFALCDDLKIRLFMPETLYEVPEIAEFRGQDRHDRQHIVFFGHHT